MGLYCGNSWRYFGCLSISFFLSFFLSSFYFFALFFISHDDAEKGGKEASLNDPSILIFLFFLHESRDIFHLRCSPCSFAVPSDKKNVPVEEVTLENPHPQHAVFKVKTTAPKDFLVKPCTGKIGPNDTAKCGSQG